MYLVKIILDEDGDPHPSKSWHLSDPCSANGSAVFCTGEYFGIGESACTFKTKKYMKGGITCSDCLYKLLTYKKIEL